MRKRRAKANVKVSHSKPPNKFKGRFTRKGDGGSSDFADSDVDSDDFYHDEIDDFHNDQEKILLHDDRSFRANFASKEEEVMPITDDEDDSEDDDVVEEEEDEVEDEEDQQSIHKSDLESDLEEKSDDDLPNLDAWGKKKSMYYNADFVDKDWGKSYREEDADEAKAEEMGALEIQRNFGASDLTNDVFDLDTFKVEKEPVDEKEIETTVRDWNAVSAENKLKLLKRDSPELFLLAEDFKELMKELIECISPLFELVKDGRIQGSGADYIRLKHSIILHYCMNISFYMMRKSQGASVKYHPVMKRASTYRKLLNQLQPLDEKLKPEIDCMLEKLKHGEDIEFDVRSVSEAEEDKETPVDKYASVTLPMLKRILEEQRQAANKSKKQKVSDSLETETEKEVQSLYMDMKKKQRDAKLMSGFDVEDEFQEDEEDNYDEDNELEEFENDGDGATDEKRTITYEIAKNKGLLPYRKKEYRNPRVRNRMKYRRAKIRRKGQVREPRKEVTRYGGELSGIRTDVTRSIKIK